MRLTLLVGCLSLAIGCSPSTQPSSTVSEPGTASEPAAVATVPAKSVEPEQARPDSELLTQLSEPVEVAGYKISPPSGYNRLQPPAPPGTVLNVWTGERRDDGTAAMVQLMTLTPPPGQPMPELDEAMKKFMAGIQRRRSSWSESEPKEAMLGGLKFLRQEWSGKDAATGTDMAGIMYVAVDGNSYIQLHTQDIQAHADALKLSEAAILTFTK